MVYEKEFIIRRGARARSLCLVHKRIVRGITVIKLAFLFACSAYCFETYEPFF
jgi:hypothetical protein